MNEAPYKAPPRAPVLYVKPANTWSRHESTITVPARVAQVEIGATIGMVMADRGAVAGYVLLNDLSVPHESFFRPPVRFRCLDGFLGVASELLPAGPGVDPAQIRIDVRINGAVCQQLGFSQLVRSPTQLLQDVQSFMTLDAGDVLMLGCDILEGGGRPLARGGDRIELSAPGLGVLANTLLAEAA
jgi:5-oxopent-3-ene-1,2,5-tricarboxylate decarboxylase/2-hydroxyhepta-2,4-diene-1,7-dioate isomerase